MTLTDTFCRYLVGNVLDRLAELPDASVDLVLTSPPFHRQNPAGAPPLDWFMHNPAGYPGAHYATWDADMLVETIESMCPRRVCVECGRPSWRITRRKSASLRTRKSRAYIDDGRGIGAVVSTDVPDVATFATFATIGWTCCGCGHACVPTRETGQREDGWRWAIGPWGSKNQGIVEPGTCDNSHWRAGAVLDPFAGTGTTGAVAHGHGRNCTLIDLDPRNVDLAQARVGMWLTVDDTTPFRDTVDVPTGNVL